MVTNHRRKIIIIVDIQLFGTHRTTQIDHNYIEIVSRAPIVDCSLSQSLGHELLQGTVCIRTLTFEKALSRVRQFE